MSEELDNDLKRRISEVFDNYEDHTADEGWMMLREKFPATAKHRGTAWLWWASAAAMFLLFLGVGLWLKNEPGKPDNDTFARKPATSHNDITTQNTAPSADLPAVENSPSMAGNITPTGSKVPANNPGVKPFAQQEIKVQPEVTTAQIMAAIKNIPPPVDPVTADTAVNVATKVPAQVYAATQNPNSSVVEKKEAAVQRQAPQQKSAMEAMLEREAMANTGKVAEKSKTDKAVHFGVFAGTHMNYAEGSENKLNVGAGFSSDFRISKNLKLSTGVSIAQNSFNYQGSSNDVPKVAVEASMVAKTLSNNKFFDPSGTSAAPTLNNYNARLTGLDIPVNLKYEFNPEKSDTYISAGLSSGTFINENYTYRYDYPAPFSTAENQEMLQVDEKINNSFNGFYFARTLNVAFGVGYPLGKNNRLVIEPFVKYPLSGLGAQQIRFGAGGINLKLNFQTRK
ncbi:hypothetical protein DJ568_01055 [Mucilaginibacter hurinus]|uniref:Outer membrane protein beta-barrel domain-containing protein n=1 Tax=Mucilaginibacter hurinus TaxID=2201324 RepID=A0A367GUG6_9SPHI|nr:outer membrane beta-barrel protein [Mucilaginibacter hurinus]RCH56476.1 hypothetical protein DJ568_01055 [Mucilaginibacter hurinus]